jgi:hypothetical protein
MKITKHKMHIFFFCTLDEKNDIKLINLNSYDNKYSYKLYCKITKNKNIFFKKYNYKVPKIQKNNFKTFVEQYI